MRASCMWWLALVLVARTANAQEGAAGSDVPQGEEEPSEEADPSRPPSRGKGAVWGVVSGKSDGLAAVEAVVTVLSRGRGAERRVTTDLDGRYRLELAPGVYELRVQGDLYVPARMKNVRVVAGRVARIDVPLETDATATEEITAVEAELERSGAAAQHFLRKNAAQASDAIGAQDIAKSPDRNAADAVRRVVGATVEGGKYVVVRGLGDRYTASLLNGAPLPSPEPDRQAVPLDMFPTLVISDLTISKTFLPNMPGDFAGGLLDIHTRDMPHEPLFQVQLGLGLNSLSTFRDRRSYAGGATDFLGVDDGSRALPREVPREKVTRLTPNGEVNPALTQVGKAMSRPMESEPAFSLPHGSLSVVAGNSWKLGRDKRHVLGAIAGVTYSRRFSRRPDEIVRTYGLDPSRPGELVRFNDYRADTGLDTVSWSGLGTVSYAVGTDHKIALTGLYSRHAEKEARLITGWNDEQGNEIRDERLRFVNRAMAYGQLRGDHRFRDLGSAELSWNAVWARATLNDPDLRETVYVADGDRGYSFRESTQSGQHFFAAQGETTRSAGFRWSQPLAKVVEADTSRVPKLEAGGLATLRGRSFNARRFRFLRVPGADDALYAQPPNRLFDASNVGTALELEEWTRPTDAYAAQYDVYAGYMMADVPLTSRLRFIAGERLEVARQELSSYDPFGGTAENVRTTLSRTDLLPSGNLVFKVSSDSNIRLSATRTVARPQLRELAPFVFSDFFGAREVLGNPDLERTRIVNLDARYEIFPRAGEVLAVSLFHKDFDQPIETIILPTSRGVISYANAKGAVNTGLELEGRHALDFLSKSLREVSILGNVTVVHSRVELDPLAGGTQTTRARPLAGQAPFVLNLALDYNREASKTRARVLYNVSGARIAQVGSNGLPDVYEQPRHLVDVSAAQGIGDHVDLKLTIENVLNSPVRLTQGEDARFLVQRYPLGTTAWVLVSYTN